MRIEKGKKYLCINELNNIYFTKDKEYYSSRDHNEYLIDNEGSHHQISDNYSNNFEEVKVKNTFEEHLNIALGKGYSVGTIARWNYSDKTKREGIIEKFYWADGDHCLAAEIKLESGKIDYIPILLKNVWAEIVSEKPVYENGFWYKSSKGNLVLLKSFERGACCGFSYGTNNTEWRDGMTFNTSNYTWVKATQEEVINVLSIEATKRGFGKIGVHFFDYGEIETSNIEGFHFWNIASKNSEVNKFNISVNTNKGVIYRQGKWSEIVPEISIKDAEVKLMCKIV